MTECAESSHTKPLVSARESVHAVSEKAVLST
jgi:hypothetical protein